VATLSASPHICSAPGCSNRVNAHGLCYKHERRMRVYGSLDLPPKPSDEDRFWAQVDKSDDCWEWTGGRSQYGYGRFCYNATYAQAHRYAWQVACGPIPDGMMILHTCDNRVCVRNDDEGWYEINGVLHPRRGHLWLGTLDDNMRDMVEKGRQSRGEAQRCAKLTPSIVREVRSLYAAGGVRHKDLSVRYDVTPHTIARALCRQTWKHVK
jgi:hypothetical protein